MQAPVTKSEAAITDPPTTERKLIALIRIWFGKSSQMQTQQKLNCTLIKKLIMNKAISIPTSAPTEVDYPQLFGFQVKIKTKQQIETTLQLKMAVFLLLNLPITKQQKMQESREEPPKTSPFIKMLSWNSAIMRLGPKKRNQVQIQMTKNMRVKNLTEGYLKISNSPNVDDWLCSSALTICNYFTFLISDYLRLTSSILFTLAIRSSCFFTSSQLWNLIKLIGVQTMKNTTNNSTITAGIMQQMISTSLQSAKPQKQPTFAHCPIPQARKKYVINVQRQSQEMVQLMKLIAKLQDHQLPKKAMKRPATAIQRLTEVTLITRPITMQLTPITKKVFLPKQSPQKVSRRQERVKLEQISKTMPSTIFCSALHLQSPNWLLIVFILF